MPDIIYHYIKFSRGYDKMFDLFGADHKSYVCRLKIALSYLKIEKDKLEVLIQQIIHLTKNGQEFKMSKRTGNSLTARDLLSTIGLDAAR
ncbi:hypothetical protein FACS189459_3170 [Bacilli bacterium]|nr:hypothetical protein FACS189459_3170 [Bacilli bacterium]